MGGPEMAPHTPHTLGAPRRSRGTPRYSDRLLAKLAAPREPAQRRAGEPREDPLLREAGAEPPVEADRRRVPVEHRPLHAPTAAPHGDPRQRAQEGLAGAVAALLGQHEQVFEVERGLRQEGGVREEVECEADGAGAAPADQRLEIAAAAEAVSPHRGGGGDALGRETLVTREAADQLADHAGVARRSAADGEPCLRYDTPIAAPPGGGHPQPPDIWRSSSVDARAPSRRFSSEMRSSLPCTRRHSPSSRMNGLQP